MALANPLLHFFPRQARRGVVKQIRFSSGELLKLPLMHGHFVGLGCKVVPQVFDELKFLGRAEVETRNNSRKGLRKCCTVARTGYSQRGCEPLLL